MNRSEIDTITFETISCPVCHTGGASEFLHVFDRLQPADAQAYRLVKCNRCSLIYLNPRPVEAASGQFYHDAAYLPFASAKHEQAPIERLYVQLRRWNNRWKRRWLEKAYPQKGALLDIGCGTGEFMQEMQNAGWKVRGVEKDPRAAAYAMEHLKLNVFIGSIDSIPAVDGTYDVITMWHVLEHLYEPHKALIRARDLLKPGGLLLIAVPNVESLDAKVYRNSWIAFDAPRHLQHFRLKTLRMICGMHKLSYVRHENIPLDAFFNAMMSELLDAERKGRKNVIYRGMRLIRGVAVAKMALLAGFITRRSWRFRGSSLMTLWRKEA